MTKKQDTSTGYNLVVRLRLKTIARLRKLAEENERSLAGMARYFILKGLKEEEK